MESHVLNTYHQARYRSIGHKLLRSSESLSEGSCKTSPEYEQSKPEYDRYQYWKGHDWSRNQTINMTRSQDTSSDEEENIEVQELYYDDRPSDAIQGSDADVVEEHVLVEGDDYDVIQVYAVDPDLDLEASSDDEEHEDFSIGNYSSKDDIDNENSHRKHYNSESQGLDVLNFNLDTPVVSNVDEYFIKEDKDILAVKDEPVVQDVDEYFIKEERCKTPNVDDFFIKEKLPEQFEVPKPVDVNEFFVAKAFAKVPDNVKAQDAQNVEQNTIEQNDIDQNDTDQNYIDKNDIDQNDIDQNDIDQNDIDQNDIDQNDIDQNEIDNTEVPINESDLEILPNIEDLKRFLLEDMSCSKFKNLQRSCSLPQSPMHNICLDIDDAKTCLSFEDLNLDLSDLSFENDKDKSGNSVKSYDIPRTLTDEDINSFLITNKPKPKHPTVVKHEDDLSHQDMEIEHPVESTLDSIIIPPTETPKLLPKEMTSTPVKPTLLNYCIEKTPIKKEKTDIKTEAEDFVDVESCNDVVIPVLEANNLHSLLEQFEATEKLNTKSKRVVKVEEPKVKSVSLTNGTRLQDAGVQLNKTKMRQILMPSTVNATVRRSPSPVHSDHDYCSSKKRYSLPNIKGGQSLLKPEVLSSNNKILSSRHRSCKNKKVVYALSSDDESDKKNKTQKTSDDSDIKFKKLTPKQTVKVITQPTRKKLSPVHSPNDVIDKDKSNSSVIVKDACKASDTPCSRNSNGSIKLTIKNKSEVILNCDAKDSQKDKPIEKCKSSVSEKTDAKVKVEAQNNIKNKSIKNIKDIDSNKKSVSNIENCTNVVKEETRPKAEHFYTALFSNKQDVQIPQASQVKSEKRSFEEEISIVTKLPNKNDAEQPQKKKKLNLQEYKLRRCVGSNNSSATVSPEAIFPDMPSPFIIDKAIKTTPNRTPPDGATNVIEQRNSDAPKKIFDPIREASRKILMNTKKQKAEAMRKRDEDIVMSKIPKVENLELQPLISDAEMMKIVGIAPEAVPVVEKPHAPTNYEEIVMVSIGTNTEDVVFKELEKQAQRITKSQSPPDSKSTINFRIKKSEHVLKQNVFDVKRDKRSPVDERKPEVKIDRARFKDITATLKSVGKQVDTKKCTNSLFASIQDVVMKKAPDEISEKAESKRTKSNSPKRKGPAVKTTIVRDYDVKADHGEDKVILHLGKDRTKPNSSTINTQTEPNPEFVQLKTIPVETHKTPPRKRNDSDMSMSSESSPVRKESKELEKSKDRHMRSESKEKRSRSRDRYDKYKRSRSPSRSRSRRRRRSHSRSRSRSRGRYRRYRRSDSPYRRKRRSRSPYRRRSPSIRREYRSNRSRSRNTDTRSKSPKKRSPQHTVDRKPAKSLTPPPRKPTISESSDSSSSSSLSSSDESRKSRESRSPYRRDEFRNKEYRSSYSSEDRESNTPVEERRIVFVGKLEKDITKSALRSQFSKFGPVMEVRLHSKEDGSRYGFVTYQRARDAWSAVEAAGTFPQYDVGFGGRRAFCRQSYADLDGLEAKYTEIAFHGQAALPPRRDDDMSFEQMLLEMKKKLSQRKGDKKRPDEDKP